MDRFDPYPSDRLQFAPPVAKTEVNFIVLDQRSPDDKLFRESTNAKYTYLYGDRQFFPLLTRIVATHFAEAFPHDPPTIQLILRHIDVIDHVPRPYGDIRYAGDGGWAEALEIPFIAAYRALHPNPNLVTCRLSGVYGGVDFDEEVSVGYERVRSKQHADAVTAAILAAITKAIDSIRTDRRNLTARQLK